MPSKLIKTFYALVFVFTSFTFANAADLNLPGFTGQTNSTVTTGFSARIDRNCESVRGYKRIDSGMTTFVNNGGYNNEIAAASASAYLTDGEGCASRKTDGYGNAGNVPRNITSENADDGNMNFDGGDIFDATTRVYTEITGQTDAGVGVNLSLVGSYNAVDRFTSPTFKPFTASQLDNIEQDIDLLNAYVTTDLTDDISLTAGRFVTSWGESTFIPVGMNGLTTNALDLVALRVPGSSIKEALLPTEQITLSGYLDGGVSYEAYYQINEEHVTIDEAGTYFGSEVASETGNRLIFNGSYGSHTGDARDRACSYLATSANTVDCDADQVASWKASTKVASSQYTMGAGLTGMLTGDNSTALLLKSYVLAAGAATQFGGSANDISSLVSLGASGYAGLAAGMAAWDEYSKKGGNKIGTIDLAGNGHQYADGDDQYGLALRTYLDDVGSGVELGFYFTQYDSKVPYLRYKGQQGVYAGDLFGAFQLAASGTKLADRLSGAATGFELTGNVTMTDAETAGLTAITQALGDLTFSSGACGAYMNPHLANEIYAKGTSSNFLYTSEEKANALDAHLYTLINGELYFDSKKCATQATVHSRVTTLQGAAALLGAAVTPLNMAEYEFIYPENLQAMGISMNTNIGPTMVNAELTYRPDFPLHTAPADQGQQLSDAAGTTQLLIMGVAQGIYAADTTMALALNSYRTGTGDSDATREEMLTAAAGFKRSYLPEISLATVAAGDYYTTPYFEYDVFSGTIGTTSSFTASHPVTAGLLADSAFLVTELGFVAVPDLVDSKPVNRGGYRDGIGGYKCGGINLSGTTFNSNKALDGMTHLGSAQTDPLFGNGSYCESKNTADDLAMTYRLVGGATYNNISNTPWTFSPSVVWSHDFKGYAPSTMGGWVPGKMSLSLTGTLSKGDTSIGLSYVNQLGDKLDNLAYDRDYISANVSYAF